MTTEQAFKELQNDEPWIENSNKIWLASTINLARNIEKYKFPSKLQEDRRRQIVSFVGKELVSMPELKKPILYLAEQTNAVDKEFLDEHFLNAKSYTQAQSGEGFLVDESGEFLITLNLDDHVQFNKLEAKGDLEGAWNRLVKIETGLGQSINYAFSSKYGFLTADPTRSGTALSATVFLQLPGLIHQGLIDEFIDKEIDESHIVTGIQGNPTEIIGDVLAIQNAYSLGVTEETIISSLKTLTYKIIDEEKKARDEIKKSQDPAIKDKVSRAYAILIHSYQIDAIEALNAISLLKLGLEMQWLTGLKIEELNHLFFSCRRAHLTRHLDQKLSQDEILHKRAEFIHKTLSNLKLTM